MSEKLGPMTFGKKEEEIFLGRDFTQTADYSESTAIEIDSEVRRIIQESYHKAKDLLKTNLALLLESPNRFSRKKFWMARKSMPLLETSMVTAATR